MPKLIIMVGIPGSGRTEWAKAKAKKGYLYFNEDEFRSQLNLHSSRKLRAAMLERTKSALEHDRDVILDAPNLTRRVRRHIMNSIRSDTYITVAFLNKSLFKSIQNNWRQSNPAPLWQVLYQALRMQRPHLNEHMDSFIDLTESHEVFYEINYCGPKKGM